MNRDFEREYIMAVDSGYQKSLQLFIQETIKARDYAFAIDSGYQGTFKEFLKACKERDKEPPQAVVTKDGVYDSSGKLARFYPVNKETVTKDGVVNE